MDGMTPLMAVGTPNIDKMAKEGFGGLTNNVPDAYTPGSDVANMSIFDLTLQITIQAEDLWKQAAWVLKPQIRT